MKNSAAIGLGCAFVVGLAVAFMAGLLVASRAVTDYEARSRVNRAGGALFNPYSPNPMSDPYFIEQQRKNVEALERACRQTGQYCNEAAQMRQWLAQRGAAP